MINRIMTLQILMFPQSHGWNVHALSLKHQMDFILYIGILYIIMIFQQ